jgi:hypothetical protein
MAWSGLPAVYTAISSDPRIPGGTEVFTERLWWQGQGGEGWVKRKGWDLGDQKCGLGGVIGSERGRPKRLPGSLTWAAGVDAELFVGMGKPGGEAAEWATCAVTHLIVNSQGRVLVHLRPALAQPCQQCH